MNKNKKIVISIVVLAVIALAIFAFRSPKIVEAMESYFDRVRVSTATTTPSYMTPGTGTSTLAVDTWNVDKVDLFINMTASTSVATLNWTYEYSNNGIDWYYEDAQSVTGTSQILHASTTVTHSWRPGSTVASTTRKVLTLPDIASNYKRVTFFLPIGTTNASIWYEFTAKRNAQ